MSNTADREIVISRLLKAPRALVFDAWTDPKHVAVWWGPTGFTTTTHSMQVKTGGQWRFVMHGLGTDFPNRISYEEVVRPERLVYWHGSDEDNDPNRFHVTVTFADEAGGTRLTMRSLFPTAAARDFVVREHKAIEGGNQTMDRLEAHVAKGEIRPTQEALDLASAPAGQRTTQHATFTVERTLKYPPEKVFAAWADPKAKARWFGGTAGQWKELVRENDFRVGGRDRLKGAWEGGVTSDFQCQYQEIVPNERIVYVYDMHMGDRKISISLATIEFKAVASGTRIVVTEQGAFLDGYDDAGSRERGTSSLMDKLVESLG